LGDETRTPTFADYVMALDRRKWLLVGGWCLVIALVAAYNEVAPPIYSAEAKLQLGPPTGGRAGITLPVDIGLPELQQLSGSADMGTQVEILKSQSLRDQALSLVVSHPQLLKAVRNGEPIESVLARLPAEPGGPVSPLQEARARTRILSLSVDQIAKTSVAAIAAESADPGAAADAANALTLAYLRANLTQLQAAAKRAGAYVSERLALAERQLEEAETALQTFLEAADITSPEADVQMRATRVAELARTVAEAKAQAEAQQAAIGRLKELLKAQPETIVSTVEMATNPVLAELERQLTNLEIERVGLLARYKPGTPQVDALDARIAEVRKRAAAEAQEDLSTRQEAVNPLRQNLQTQLLTAQIELAAAHAREAAANRYLRQARSAAERVPEDQRRLADLRRAVTVAEQAYLQLKQLEQRYAIAEESQVPSAQVVQIAQPSPAPVKPNKRMNLLGALAGGLLVGMALVLIGELLDDTFHSAAEVERYLGTPVLGVVHRARDARSLAFDKQALRSAHVEAFRTLRSNLAFAAADSPLRLLLVTSSGIGDGKTTVAANLAAAFAQSGSNVLLVDADLRRPCLHRLFGLDNCRGLTHVLTGEAELEQAVVRSSVERLAVLTSGPLSADVAGLLDSSDVRRLLEQLRGRYDLVILNSAPAGLVADAQILGAEADGIVLVLEMGKSRRDAVATAKALLERSRGKVLGVVVNKAKGPRGGMYEDHDRERA
jgi:succinoglycan biosynthesis transport protein ExoP